MRLEGLGKLKEVIHFIGYRARNRSTCSTAPNSGLDESYK
jgi:hypothetical protein